MSDTDRPVPSGGVRGSVKAYTPTTADPAAATGAVSPDAIAADWPAAVRWLMQAADGQASRTASR